MALGVLGLSLDDFDALTPDEFEQAYSKYREAEQSRLRENWEQTRMLATIFVQPFSKKKVTPRTLLPFPWDQHKDEHEGEKAPRSTPDRFKQLVELLGQDGK